MQELAHAEFLKEWANDPWVNPREARLRVFKAARVDRPEELILEEPPPNPEVERMASEDRLRTVEVKAKAVQTMALAIKNLADAELASAKAGSTVSQEHLAWAQAQMDAMQREVEDVGSLGGGT
jgi:hypothetical protein